MGQALSMGPVVDGALYTQFAPFSLSSSTPSPLPFFTHSQTRRVSRPHPGIQSPGDSAPLCLPYEVGLNGTRHQVLWTALVTGIPTAVPSTCQPHTLQALDFIWFLSPAPLNPEC